MRVNNVEITSQACAAYACAASGDLFVGERAHGWRVYHRRASERVSMGFEMIMLTASHPPVSDCRMPYYVTNTNSDLSTGVSHLHGFPRIRLAMYRLFCMRLASLREEWQANQFAVDLLRPAANSCSMLPHRWHHTQSQVGQTTRTRAALDELHHQAEELFTS